MGFCKHFIMNQCRYWLTPKNGGKNGLHVLWWWIWKNTNMTSTFVDEFKKNLSKSPMGKNEILEFKIKQEISINKGVTKIDFHNINFTDNEMKNPKAWVNFGEIAEKNRFWIKRLPLNTPKTAHAIHNVYWQKILIQTIQQLFFPRGRTN